MPPAGGGWQKGAGGTSGHPAGPQAAPRGPSSRVDPALETVGPVGGKNELPSQHRPRPSRDLSGSPLPRQVLVRDCRR